MGGKLSATAKRIERNAEIRKPLATKKHATKVHREDTKRDLEAKAALARQYRPPCDDEEARRRLTEMIERPLRATHREALAMIEDAFRGAVRGELVTSWCGKWT